MMADVVGTAAPVSTVKFYVVVVDEEKRMVCK